MTAAPGRTRVVPAGVAAAAAGLLVLAGLAALARISSWRKPLGTDTGQYLYIGGVILDGGTPYTDAVNNKGPMTYVLFAVVRLLAGTSMTAVRLSLLAFAVTAAVALGAYVAHHAGRAAGVLAAVGFALLAGVPAFQGSDPNTEQYGIAFIVAGWWLATSPAPRRAVAAGAATGTAVAMNPAFAPALAFVAFELWRAGPAGRERRLALGAAGALAVAVPLLAWLVARGAADDMWHHVVEYATGQADGSVGEGGVPAAPEVGGGAAVEPPPAAAPPDPPAASPPVSEPPAGPQAFTGSGAFVLPAPGLWIAGLAGLLLACTDARLRRVALPLIAWVAVGWARVKVASYEYPHHYYPVVPALVAGLALGAARLWSLTAQPRVRHAIAVVAIGIPVWVWVAKPERTALDVPPGERWGPTVTSYALAYPIAAFVREHTEPEERILVVGGDPEVYWLADRRASTRYFDVFPLLVEERLVDRRAEDVARDPPAAIVAMPGAEDVDPSFPALLDLHKFPPAFELRGARVWLHAG